MTYGLTATGFLAKTMEVIREEMNAEARTAFGNSVGVTDDDVLGRLIAIVAEREANLWELAEAVNSAMDPDANSGASQDSIAAISGTTREAAAPSTATLTLTGTAATSVLTGSQASLSSTLKKFETLADATLVAAGAWAISTAYALADRVTNNGNVYQCITAGTSAGSGGPTTDAPSITDGSVTWRYLGPGTADVDVEAECTVTGPVVAASGDIDTIETAVSGWSGVINVLDADLGSDAETTAALRARRETELAAAGTTPKDALRVDLLTVSGVTTVKIFENDTDTTDADGMPPHSVEALVQGGTDQAIWDKLLSSKAAGVKAHGTEVGTATDSEGNALEQKFSRPSEVDIHCALTLTYDASLYPTDGDAQIKAAIVAWGDLQSTGKDVTSSGVSARAFSVAGVLDVSLAYINTANPAIAEATIPIGTRELAVFDTSRITITSTPATP